LRRWILGDFWGSCGAWSFELAILPMHPLTKSECAELHGVAETTAVQASVRLSELPKLENPNRVRHLLHMR
jgi:hypothetical protein